MCVCGLVAAVNCAVSPWSSFGNCSAACGSGLRTRTRTILLQAQGRGDACPTLEDSITCDAGICGASHLHLMAFSSFSDVLVFFLT